MTLNPLIQSALHITEKPKHSSFCKHWPMQGALAEQRKKVNVRKLYIPNNGRKRQKHVTVIHDVR
jgi:hypothetical protein